MADLYPGILGESWRELADSVRRAHAVDREQRGRFRVSHGKRCGAPHLIRWSRLPREDSDAPVALRIHADGHRQRWERSFGADAFTTIQWAVGRRLVERIDYWEIHFALRVVDRALVYEQCGARLCLGPIRVPVPLAFAPQVRAIEEADGPTRVNVRVTVNLPLFGLLIEYDGYLDVEEVQS